MRLESQNLKHAGKASKYSSEKSPALYATEWAIFPKRHMKKFYSASSTYFFIKSELLADYTTFTGHPLSMTVVTSALLSEIPTSL